MTAAPLMGAPVRMVLFGATGRMGIQILKLLPQFSDLRLCGAVASPQSQALGEDAAGHAGMPACGVPIEGRFEQLLDGAALAIDFSSANAVAAHLAGCVTARVPLLIGATGLSASLEPALAEAATRIPLLVAPNTSPGVNLLLALVLSAARALPDSYDIEILESHHRHKVDAPSGTALALGAAAAEGRRTTLERSAVYSRHGQTGPRHEGQIGFATLRGGDVVGEHQVHFLGDGERLVLQHSASDRSVFARGALIAGRWLAGQAPGRYRMSDIFF